MSPDPEKELLVRVARAVLPARTSFVVVGGAAHQLFWLVDLAQPVDFRTLRTFDADIAVDASVRHGSLRIDERLASEGFRAEPTGDATPPATRYVLESDRSHYVQFVAHRTGSGVKRSGLREPTAIVAGAVVEKLRHVDLLLHLPWTVELRAADGFEVGGERLELRIANAACYLAQKLLVLNQRDPRDRAKDLVYVHDTLRLFTPALEHLAQIWQRVEPWNSKRRRDVLARAVALALAPTDDTRRAAQLLKSLDRADVPDERRLRAVLDHGLSQLFGSR